MAFDVVIRNGTVVDGTGAEPFRADVGVAGDRIAAVGIVEAPARLELDVHGCLVTPGFVDVHSHSDYTLLVDPRAVSALHQGVTLEVIGNCGHGCFPIDNRDLALNSIYGYHPTVPIMWKSAAEYFERLQSSRPAVNVISLVPNGQLRLAIVGLEARAATPREAHEMNAMLRQALDEGAWGFSTGLEYAAEMGASEEEIQGLCQTVAHAGGLYATHTRRRDAGAVEAVEEAVRVARATGVRVQVSHLLPRSGPADSARCVDAVEEARMGGLDIAFDMHTRPYGVTYLSAALPPWAGQHGRERLADYLRDVDARERMKTFPSILSASGDWRRIVLFDNPVWPEYANRSLAEIAEEREQDPFDAVCDLLLEGLDNLERLMVLIHCYSEREQEDVFAHPLCVPGSDATDLAPDGPLAESTFHGAYTWASWFYRFMVREKRRLSTTEAIHKLTGAPAAILNLTDRGVLRVGAYADIAVFDPGIFGEKGTMFSPNRLAVGMVHVLVNGAPTLCDGALTGARNGFVLRRLSG